MFDLGGVLVENDLFDELAKLMPIEITEEALKGRWLSSVAVRTFELGRCAPSEFGRAMVDEFELSCTPAHFVDAFAGWPKGFYPGVDSLLRELRSRYRVACLSNSNELHWTGSVTSHFDVAYSSHLLQRIKPDAEVFEFVTSDLGCNAADIIFFDDSEPNVSAARDVGWQAHLTVGYAALMDKLRQAV